MRNNRKRERAFQPAQFLAISFVAAILVGTLLLLLPFSTKSGHISLVDALFTATSSVCVTGLIVQDTATYFTSFGQIIILILFQLGGLGIMTFSTLILLAAGKKISIRDRIFIQQDFHHGASKDVKSLIKNIFIFTLAIETVGTLSFFLRWHKDFDWLKALFHSVFHSISAFCNAGLSLFSDSFVAYRNDTWINTTLIVLIVAGGLGFLVLDEVRCVVFSLVKRKKFRISLHAKLVLIMTVFLLFFPFVFFLFIEWNHSLQTFTAKEKIFSSLFQIITPRTAGFNTVDLNSLSFSIVFLLILLMFIGASPGSTGGGVKTSTIGVIFAFIKSKITARDSVNLFYRTLPLELVTKAFTVVSLSVFVISISAFVLLLTQPGVSMRGALFEVFSAFGTVGLSLGLTPNLNPIGKIMIVLTMYIGRIGPLTLLYAFSKERAYGRFEYLEETVMIG
jgi:trk system potassium uptake protein TrkH